MNPIAEKLLKWYRANARNLPWRNTKDPYKIWISEIMLQQTTVNAVIPYYKKWIRKYPTVDHVAESSVQDILKSWQGLGYYSRAKNIHNASKILITNYNGKLPKEPIEFIKLPGVGQYTMGAVLSIAFDQRLPIVDANVRRVFMRLNASNGFATTDQDKWIYLYLEKILPKKRVGDFNQSIMELGALICRSKEPVCILCPIKKI